MQKITSQLGFESIIKTRFSYVELLLNWGKMEQGKVRKIPLTEKLGQNLGLGHLIDEGRLEEPQKL